MNSRPAAVAGTFYPDDPVQLRAAISGYLKAAVPDDSLPKAIIAPHAGYVYSGPVAGSAYARVAALRDQIRRVVLIGPAHRVPVTGVALSSADSFETPLGAVPLDKAAFEILRQMPQVVVSDEAHAEEHSLEVHLPFLQEVLAEFTLVPLAAGDGGQIVEVFEALWDPPRTMLIVSSDLSHFLTYEKAKALDARTARAIEALRPLDIREQQACGAVPIKALLTLAARKGLRPKTLDLRNSGDTAGGRDRVVGYGAFAFS